MTRNICYILSLSFLIAGTLIYVFFRNSVYFLLPFHDLAEKTAIIKIQCGILGNFIIYNFSDACWCLSLMFYATTSNIKWIRILAFFIPTCMELLQLTNLVPGTFDPIDLIIYIIISISFFYLWKRKNFFQQC